MGSGESRRRRPPLIRRLGWALADAMAGDSTAPAPYDAVKLVHADDLQRWERFPRCQELDGITYGEFRAGARDLEVRRREVADLIDARAELDRLAVDDVVEYRTLGVDVPRSLARRRVRVPLPELPLRGTRVETSLGTVRDGRLEVEGGWRSQRARLAYRGPSSVVNADRIGELQHTLAVMTDAERRELEAVRTSRFAQPVLFVSHRWDDPSHPDPTGRQLRALRTLRDCFVIYDYSSFPQEPRTDAEEVEFKAILDEMGALIRNVLVLHADDYLDRGWCVYEYIVASLHRSTVCDAIQDSRFVALRDWASTAPPVALSFRDSFESQQQNYIDRQILEAMSEVLPIFNGGAFVDDHDRRVVTRLLTDHLKATLPKMKQHQEYMGEWRTIPWADEDLEPLFAGRAPAAHLQAAIGVQRLDSHVPSRLEDAVSGGYAIRRYDAGALDPLGSLRQASLLRVRR